MVGGEREGRIRLALLLSWWWVVEERRDQLGSASPSSLRSRRFHSRDLNHRKHVAALTRSLQNPAADQVEKRAHEETKKKVREG